MHKTLLRCVVLMVLILGAVSTVKAADVSRALVLSGVVLEQGNNDLIARFTRWLSKHADYPLRPLYTASYKDLSDHLAANPHALAWTCGVPYVEDRISFGQQLVAVPLFAGKPYYHSLVMSRAGRPEKGLADFKGKVFAYSDPRSNSGFIVPSYALKQQGYSIHDHFRYLMHTGMHEYSIEALLAGQADVANIDEYVVVEYFKAHPELQGQLVELERFGPYPFTPVVAGSQVPTAVVQRLQQALVSMHEDGEGRDILDALGLDGFVVQSPEFYDPIAKMLKAVK